MKYDLNLLDQVILRTEQYFSTAYYAGTREMVYRYVCDKIGGDVPPVMVSAALKIIKDRGIIVWDKRVWWKLGGRP